MRKILLAFLLVLFIIPTIFALSNDWACDSGSSPYNPDAQIISGGETTIFSIQPQEHPITFPGGKLLVQLNSKDCQENVLVFKSSTGSEIARQSEMPYSPWPNCDIPTGYEMNDQSHLTNIIFNTALGTFGEHMIEIYNPSNTLLASAQINIRNPETAFPTIRKGALCNIGDYGYPMNLEVPYPLISTSNTESTIKVTVGFGAGERQEEAEAIFDNLILQITKGQIAKEDLTKINSTSCSNYFCEQEYLLPEIQSATEIVYVFHDEGEKGKSAIISQAVTVLELEKLESIDSKLVILSNVAKDYIARYKFLNQVEEVAKWEAISNRLEALSSESTRVISYLKNPNFTIQNVADLIDFIKETPNEIGDIKEMAGGENL
jgi:hypothetical protein